MSLTVELLKGIWLIIPAYVANLSAPLANGTTPMDGGLKVRGRELLGAGKTWEGFMFAVIAGTLTGIIATGLQTPLNGIAEGYGFRLPAMSLLGAFLLSLGAMLGDVVGSLVKRQSGIKRGDPAPLLDQLDFVLGGFILAAPFVEMELLPVVMVVVFTPLFHLLTNLIGYKLGRKSVPW